MLTGVKALGIVQLRFLFLLWSCWRSSIQVLIHVLMLCLQQGALQSHSPPPVDALRLVCFLGYFAAYAMQLVRADCSECNGSHSTTRQHPAYINSSFQSYTKSISSHYRSSSHKYQFQRRCPSLITKYTQTPGSPDPSNPATPGSRVSRTPGPLAAALSSRFVACSTSR